MIRRTRVLMVLAVCLVAALGWWSLQQPSSAPSASAPSASAPAETVLGAAAVTPLRVPTASLRMPPAPEPRPGAGDREQATATTRAFERRIASLFHEGLNDRELFPELARCQADHGAAHRACAALFDDALRKTYAWKVARTLAGDPAYAVAPLLAQLGTEGAVRSARQLAAQTLQQSTDPVERVASLALAERLLSEAVAPPPPYAADVYDGLSVRSTVERGYLLREYERAPVPAPRIARELVSIALNDGEYRDHRRVALRALGAARAGAEFAEALQTLEARSAFSEQGALDVVGPALASCSGACIDSYRRLAEHADPNARLAVLVGLGTLPRADLDAVANAVLPELVARADLTPIERDQLAFVQQRVSGGTR